MTLNETTVLYQCIITVIPKKWVITHMVWTSGVSFVHCLTTLLLNKTAAYCLTCKKVQKVTLSQVNNWPVKHFFLDSKPPVEKKYHSGRTLKFLAMSQQSLDKARQDHEFKNMEIARQVKSNLPDTTNQHARNCRWLLTRSSNYNPYCFDWEIWFWARHSSVRGGCTWVY